MRKRFFYFILFTSFAGFTLLLAPRLVPLANVNQRLSTTFSPVEKQYFIECLMEEDLLSRRNTRWKSKEITYSISGNFTDHESAFIAQTLSKISQLQGVPMFRSVIDNGSLKFYKPDSENAYHKLPKDYKGDTRGFVDYNKNLLNYITSAVININPNQSQQSTFITIQHEIIHSLGLLNHPTSIFKEDSALGKRYFTLDDSYDTISTELPRLDRSALKLLYDPEMPIFTSRKPIARFIAYKGS